MFISLRPSVYECLKRKRFQSLPLACFSVLFQHITSEGVFMYICIFAFCYQNKMFKCLNVAKVCLSDGGESRVVVVVEGGACGGGEWQGCDSFVCIYFFGHKIRSARESVYENCPCVMQMLWNTQSKSLSAGNRRIEKDKRTGIKRHEKDTTKRYTD